MRSIVLPFALTLFSPACDGLDDLKEPPQLVVTSPQRSLIQDGTAAINVTGTVGPNVNGSPVKRVMVNGIAATLAADGTFAAQIDVRPGAMLIHTEATSADGGVATDTRSVEAGELRAQGANIDRAIGAAISKQAFGQIAGMAGTMIETTDFRPMLMAMNPVAHSGDENGEDCLFGRVYVDDFKLTNADISLVPVAGGLQFRFQVDGVDVPGRVRWAVSCYNSSNAMRVTADRIVVAGTLVVTPDGMRGFKADVASPQVSFTNLDIECEGIPDWMESLIREGIEWAVPKLAGRFMGPMLNKALGALDGPKQLDVLGKQVTVQVAPAGVAFTTEHGIAQLDMKMLIAGTETSKGFIFTENGTPAMDPGTGMQIGLADDLANEVLAQLTATGLLKIAMPAHAGTFDNVAVAMTSPPMISADPTDGRMRLILPDMMATYTLQGTPVAKTAINARVDLAVAPSNAGYGVAIDLGQLEIFADVLDDVPNQTLLTDEDLGRAVELCLDSQLAAMRGLLGSIPLPQVAGMQMKNMSVGGAEGYVLMKGELE